LFTLLCKTSVSPALVFLGLKFLDGCENPPELPK
jgi:hypothetical protein